MRHFRIYGDNIVECERMVDLLLSSLSLSRVYLKGPYGLPTNPRFILKVGFKEEYFEFTFFPGFGRWNYNILKSVKGSDGVIREAPDVVLTELSNEVEMPIIAIEFSTALSAGNQAWQRNGRAYSFGEARVPFLYVNEIGGHELSINREKKTIRLPNPAVPFSYLSFSRYVKSIVLPVYLPQDGIDEGVGKKFQAVFGGTDFYKLLKALIFSLDAEESVALLESRVLEFVKILAETGKNGDSFTPAQWIGAYNYIKEKTGNTLLGYLKGTAQIQWSKTAYIKSLTPTFRNLRSIASELSFGFTSRNLPICIIPKDNRKLFASRVLDIYQDLDSKFYSWLNKEQDLVVCWVMGFKPKGDDARPDRGLPPLARMLSGQDAEILTVVYGPAKRSHWSLLMTDPSKLSGQNGLWEAIMAVSDGILVDSSTFDQRNRGVIKEFWNKGSSESNEKGNITTEVPTALGEQDVDTLVHLIFARLGGQDVFEGFCNPPGGDWSGIFILTTDKRKRVRWFSLPRVSGSETKRPDHLIELFGLAEKPILFSIESKERARDLEKNIGTRLNSYIKNLMRYRPDIEKLNEGSSEWIKSKLTLRDEDFAFVSGAAFLINDENELDDYANQLDVDLSIAFLFSETRESCKIYLSPISENGKILAGFVRSLNLADLNLTVESG